MSHSLLILASQGPGLSSPKWAFGSDSDCSSCIQTSPELHKSAILPSTSKGSPFVTNSTAFEEDKEAAMDGQQLCDVSVYGHA